MTIGYGGGGGWGGGGGGGGGGGLHGFKIWKIKLMKNRNQCSSKWNSYRNIDSVRFLTALSDFHLSSSRLEKKIKGKPYEFSSQKNAEYENQ